VGDDPRTAWLNGRLVPWDEAAVPIEDRGLQFAESIYEVFPVIGGTPRLVAEHLERMRGGAEVIGIEAGVPNLGCMLSVADRLVAEEAVAEGILYAQVTGGSAPRHHLARPQPTFLAYLRAYEFPRAEAVAEGMTAISLTDERWAGRDLKTTMLLSAVLAKRQAAARGADEAVLVGIDGEVHEGSASNIFAVSGGRLLHPRESRHVLAGTMAPLVVECARDIGLKVEATRLQLDDLRQADELLCTATSRLAMPVLELDGRPIGTGRAGPVATEIARRLRTHFGLE
jgi:D-alanine transaminase